MNNRRESDFEQWLWRSEAGQIVAMAMLSLLVFAVLMLAFAEVRP